MVPKLKVIPGRHHDPAEGWARPPRLRPVVDLRERAVRRDTRMRLWTAAMVFALGYCTRWMLFS